MLKNCEFKHRRQQLMRQMKKNAVAIIASAPAVIRNRDVEYPYRQSSDFHYLTGLDEAEAVAVLIPGRKQGEYVLFCREYNPEKAIWTGRHAGLEGAVQDFGADEAFAIDDLEDELPRLLSQRDRVYFPIGQDSDLDEVVLTAVEALKRQSRAGTSAPYDFIALEHLLHEQRLIKSSQEIELIKKACEVTVKGHLRAMRHCRPGQWEYHIEAELLHEFNRHGLRHTAYPSIVAGGANACVLHYTQNDAVLANGDLLLIDAGAEHQCYAADVTRTYPVNGRFTKPQRLLYELVLAAQLAAIEAIKPQNRWNMPHEAAIKVLTKGLLRLGLMEGKAANLIKNEGYKKFFMHRTGHWLGMDVHDVGDYRQNGKWRAFEPGMVLTVEPGLYIPLDCLEVDPCWRGIGIRIEDDVLVTKDGVEVLTQALPKSVKDIEALMASPK